MDEKFFKIAFKYCSRGDDMKYIVETYQSKMSKKKQGSSAKLSLKNIKKLGETLKAEKYVLLNNDLVIGEEEYINLVAELTFDKDDNFRAESQIFFRLLTT